MTHRAYAYSRTDCLDGLQWAAYCPATTTNREVTP